MISVLQQVRRNLFISLLGLCVLSGTAWARAEKKAAGAAKKTTVDFEDQLVEGTTQKPELFYLLQQRNNNFKRLIVLRENFLPEMRKTSEEISRKGSGD